jgi:hypothetical protein
MVQGFLELGRLKKSRNRAAKPGRTEFRQAFSSASQATSISAILRFAVAAVSLAACASAFARSASAVACTAFSVAPRNTVSISASLRWAKPRAGGIARLGDTLTLSAVQQGTAWKDLYTRNLNQKSPAGFNVTVGAVVPNKIATSSVWIKAARDVPALEPYQFAILQKKLVIVNPSDQDRRRHHWIDFAGRFAPRP